MSPADVQDQRIAAILTIPLVMGFLYNSHQRNAFATCAWGLAYVLTFFRAMGLLG